MKTETILWILLALALAAYGQYARSRRKAARTGRSPSPEVVEETAVARSKKKKPAAPAAVPASAPEAAPPPASAGGEVSIKSWGYQLQKLKLDRAAASGHDLLVIDYSKDGSDEGSLAPDEIAALQAKPDGGRRVVLSYLSIGEAESYRFYWDKAWKKAPPYWLLGENKEWKENYAVAFWDSGWQSIVFGGPDSYLDRILDAGFDGVYLDKCDVYEDLLRKHKDVARTRQDIAGDMVAFVQRLSAYAKERRPGFLVVMQNAESLLERPELMATIDGIAKEELIFGQDAPEKRNVAGDFEDSRGLLARARDAGKLVLVVEYLNDRAKAEEAVNVAGSEGFVVYVSAKNRALDKLNDPIVA